MWVLRFLSLKNVEFFIFLLSSDLNSPYSKTPLWMCSMMIGWTLETPTMHLALKRTVISRSVLNVECNLKYMPMDVTKFSCFPWQDIRGYINTCNYLLCIQNFVVYLKSWRNQQFFFSSGDCHLKVSIKCGVRPQIYAKGCN